MYYSINGKLLTSLAVEERLVALALADDGRLLLTGGLAKTVSCYALSHSGIALVHRTAPADSSIRTLSVAVSDGAHYALAGLASGYVMVCALDVAKWSPRGI